MFSHIALSFFTNTTITSTILIMVIPEIREAIPPKVPGKDIKPFKFNSSICFAYVGILT